MWHACICIVSVDAALGKLESKKAGIYLSLTSYYCCWAIAKVKLGVHRRYVHEKGRLLIPHWHVSILGQSMYSRGGMYVRGQRANFLSTKNSQILYFALVYQHWEVFCVMTYPTDQSCPVLSIWPPSVDCDGEKLIITITLENDEKGEVDETYQDPPKNVRRPKQQKQKTENSKCQRESTTLNRTLPLPSDSLPPSLPPFPPPLPVSSSDEVYTARC